jgi:hypothetical protein
MPRFASLRAFARCVLIAVVLAAAAPGLAQAEGTFLGSRTVAYGSERDTIEVPGNAHYNLVRLCVAQRAINFYDLNFRFANGGHQDAAVKVRIGPGECTRWIDLKGEDRNLVRIVMWYETFGSSGARAVVSAYGKN